MNKLYKYLPFDIILNGTGMGYGNNTKLPIVGILKGIHYLRNDQSYRGTVVHLLGVDKDASKSFSYKLDDVKPVLRPIKDLDKKLPLTKIAAELLNRKEGDLIIPIYEFIHILFGCNTLKLDPNKKIAVMSDGWFTYYDIPTTYTMYGSKRLVKCNYTVQVSSTNISVDAIVSDGDIIHYDFFRNNADFEKGFDFLRAMHFALDFENDEFIPMPIKVK